MAWWHHGRRPRFHTIDGPTVAATGERLHLPEGWRQMTSEQLAPYGLRPDMTGPPDGGVIGRGPNSTSGGGFRSQGRNAP